jgi:hypothetical protein
MLCSYKDLFNFTYLKLTKWTIRITLVLNCLEILQEIVLHHKLLALSEEAKVNIQNVVSI